jgi:hypothetical protein
MLNQLKSLILFILNPILDDWNNKPSLIRITYVAIMYAIVGVIMSGQGVDWSVLVIVLFIMMYLCFKGEAPRLIEKLLDMVTAIKAGVFSGESQKKDPPANQ